jgi:myo-inositol-1(or 4)-monophosphatase
MDVDQLRRTAADLARAGAEAARPLFGAVRATQKTDHTPVTQADHAAQAAILGELARRHPAHAILVEEEVARPERHAALAGAEYCWLVDPIDGTRNFARGVRMYGICVAVLRAGRPVAAATHDAALGVVYSAAAGGGAWRGESPMRLPDRPPDTDTTVGISSFRRQAMPVAVRGWMDRYLFRNLGAVGLHLAWVSAGLMDAAYSAESKLWDIAAGALLVEEAGGRVTDGRGRGLWPIDPAGYRGEDVPILAAGPAMHARLLESLLAEG